MNVVLATLIGRYAPVYTADIIVFLKAPKKHLRRIEEVLMVLIMLERL